MIETDKFWEVYEFVKNQSEKMGKDLSHEEIVSISEKYIAESLGANDKTQDT